jgi:TonB-dependent receptor
MSKTILKIFLFFCLVVLPFAADAQGILKGKITDKKTNESIIGANVLVKGVTMANISDVDGNYQINGIPAGIYEVTVRYVSYQTVELKDIVIESGKATELNLQLEPAEVALAGVQIVGTRRTNTDLAMLNNTKKAQLVVSGISSQQIARTLDRDAGEVVKRVPGVTIIGNRFVVVRGLNQRYNNVWLNEVSTPSSEADSRAFSFDAIPGGVIDNLLVYKTPAPEIPADFSGGFIKIQTKNMPEGNQQSFNLSIGHQSGSAFEAFKSVSITALDWFGLGSGTRTLPSDFPTKIKSSLSNETLAGYTLAANPVWGTTRITALPDLRFSANINRVYQWEDVKAGNIIALNYSNTFRVNEIENRRFGIYQQDKDKPFARNDYKDQQFSQDSKFGIMYNWSFQLNPISTIEFRNFFNQIGKSRFTSRAGDDKNNDYVIRESENFYMSRSTLSSQLSGKHNFSEKDMRIDWVVGYSYANRHEPNRNIVTYRLNQDSLSPGFNRYRTFSSDVKRFYQSLNEHVVSLGANLEKQLYIGEFSPMLKTGVFGEYKYRTFASRNFVYNFNYSKLPTDYSYLDMENLMTTANIKNQGILLKENTNKADSYNASSANISGYVGLNMPIGSQIKVYAGVRAESHTLILDGYESDGTDPVHLNRTALDLFPSVNATYNMNEEHLLRLAYGKSINRPEFREVAPYVYYDFDQFANFEGNSNLKDATVHNLDLRYEWYPTPSETFSVALFLKNFTNPIENTYYEVGGQYQYTYRNAKSAQNYGMEVDLRKNLTFMGLSHFNLVMNASLIHSRVLFPAGSWERDRAMQGQSPYLVNVGLYYNNDDKGLKGSLMYNRIGKRILYVGVVNQKIIEDIPDTYEMARNAIDFSISKKLNEKMEIGFGIKDLLNEPEQNKQFPLYNDGETLVKREQITRSFYPGRNISLNFKMNL